MVGPVIELLHKKSCARTCDSAASFLVHGRTSRTARDTSREIAHPVGPGALPARAIFLRSRAVRQPELDVAHGRRENCVIRFRTGSRIFASYSNVRGELDCHTACGSYPRRRASPGLGDIDFREQQFSPPCLQRSVTPQVGIRYHLHYIREVNRFIIISSVELISINHERGVIYPEATVQISKEKALVRFARRGRLIACTSSPGGGSRSLTIIHLDRPRTIIEAILPDSPHVRLSTFASRSPGA